MIPTLRCNSQHGDLSNSDTSTTANSNPILHSFLVKEDHSGAQSKAAPWNTTAFIDRRLDLCVSEYGIIGRTVSIVRNHERVGEGVVGWN